MTRLQAFWTWIKPRWYIPLFVLGVILGWVLFGKRRERGTPLAQTKVELQAIEAAGQVKNKVAELGAEKAKAWVEANYQAQLTALDTKQKAQAEELKNDPPKLAAFLVRAGGSQ